MREIRQERAPHGHSQGRSRVFKQLDGVGRSLGPLLVLFLHGPLIARFRHKVHVALEVIQVRKERSNGADGLFAKQVFEDRCLLDFIQLIDGVKYHQDGAFAILLHTFCHLAGVKPQLVKSGPLFFGSRLAGSQPQDQIFDTRSRHLGCDTGAYDAGAHGGDLARGHTTHGAQRSDPGHHVRNLSS